MKNKTTELTYFRRLQKFTTVAVYLTSIMLAYLLISSFISGSVSGADTTKVVKALKFLFGADETEPTSIVAKVKKGETVYNYAGDKKNLTVTFYPSDSKKYDVSYSSSDEEVAKISDDVITFLKRGTTNITATVDGKPDLKHTFTAYCLGKSPFGGSATLKPSASQSSLKVGGRTGFIINDGETSVTCCKFSSSDESVVKIIEKTAFFVGEGSADVTALFEDSSTSKSTLNVSPNPSAVYLNDLEFVDNKDYFSGQEVKFTDIISGYKPINAVKELYATSSDENVATVKSSSIVFKNEGSATVTFYSVYDSSFSKSVDLKVFYVKPTSLEITSPDTITVNGTLKLKAKHNPEGYTDKVTFTIIKGHGKIDEDGNLRATFFDDITVRCQSTIDEDLYVDKTFKVKLYSNLYSFVRKVLGHFSLFALFGFGIWGSTFLLTNFLYSIIFSPGICFVCAGLCEMAQSITPGRYFSVADVFINFAGTLTGMLVAMLSVGMFCLIYKIANKKSYEKLSRAHSMISVKTVFFKRKKKKEKENENEKSKA